MIILHVFETSNDDNFSQEREFTNNCDVIEKNEDHQKIQDEKYDKNHPF